jgi:hypothetical protein
MIEAAEKNRTRLRALLRRRLVIATSSPYSRQGIKGIITKYSGSNQFPHDYFVLE